MAYPEWVEKQRRPGTNITCSKGKYYLYTCKCVYDKEKKRSRKITTGYLGRITEEGLVPPRAKQAESKYTVKEYGASATLLNMGTDIHEKLKAVFPKEADELMTLAILRLIEGCPFKRAGIHYEKSYLSEQFPGLPMSSASLSGFLRSIGSQRDKIVRFMNQMVDGSEHILFDGTNIITKSENLDINRLGYNSHRQFDPQINLLYAFSCEQRQPVYYRIVPGNVRDVSSFKHAVSESGIRDVTVIADKGFGSKANFEMLESNQLKYIVPLRRNNGCFDRAKLKTGDKDSFDGHFIFQKRVIWYYEYTKDDARYIVFQDSSLRMEEEKDFLQRVEAQHENYTMESYMEKQYDFGTILFRTNRTDAPEDIYKLYKTRIEIEQTFDFLKNQLEADIIYLQDKYAVEGWAFINHLSLLLTYLIYSKLRDSNILSKFSIDDFIFHLKYIHKIRIKNSWALPKISAKTQKFLDTLAISIT